MALSAAPASPHPILAAHSAMLGQASAQYKKIAQANDQFSLLRKGLDSLSRMGEAVTADDVIEEAGKLVAGGITPDGLIALMAGDPSKGQAPMPESGQALASWVSGHEAQLAQQEQQVQQAHASAAHHLGVVGLQGLMAHHMEELRKGGAAAASPQQAQASPPPANPLSS